MAIKAKMLGREAVMRRLNQLVPDAEKNLAAAQFEVAQEAASRIAARAPIGPTGDYRRSISAERLADLPGGQQVLAARPTKDRNATGVFAAWYWRFLEFGTSAHVIKAKHGRPLTFTGRDGKVVSVKSVRHPGADAKPHIFPTWRAYQKTARRKMAAAVNKAVRKAMGK